MKTKLFMLCCALITITATYSENNTYFPKGMKWTTVTIHEYSGGVDFNKEITTLQGDSLIGEKMYHKLANSANEVIGLITEEGKKIYIHHGENDILLYDFDLSVGDSLLQDFEEFGSSFYNPSQLKICVTNSDSVTLLDGRKAKRIFYDERMPDIEYIGCETGILSPIYMPVIPQGKSIAFCCSINGEPVFELSPEDCEKYDNPEDVPALQSEFHTAKFIRNGQLFIRRGDVIYTIQGQKKE